MPLPFAPQNVVVLPPETGNRRTPSAPGIENSVGMLVRSLDIQARAFRNGAHGAEFRNFKVVVRSPQRSTGCSGARPNGEVPAHWLVDIAQHDAE